MTSPKGSSLSFLFQCVSLQTLEDLLTQSGSRIQFPFVFFQCAFAWLTADKSLLNEKTRPYFKIIHTAGSVGGKVT